MFPIPRFRQGLRVLAKSSARMDERIEGARPFHEARLKLGLVAGPGRIPQVVVQLADVPGQLPIEHGEGNRHVRSPGRDGPPTEKGSPYVIRGPGLRTGRLPAAASSGAGERRNRLLLSGPIGVGLRGVEGSLRPRTGRSPRTPSPDVDLGRATRRGNPAPSGSRWHGLGGFGVPRPPCPLGNGIERIEGTWRDERTDSHRTSGDRQLYLGPEASCAPCSAGRTSEETRRSARSAAPTRSSSSNTPTETIRSSTTYARSATSAGTKAFRTGMSPRPGGTSRPTNETRG